MGNLLNSNKSFFRSIEKGDELFCFQFIKSLKDINKEIHFKNELGRDFFSTAICLSCQHNRAELVKYAIELGADVNKKDAFGNFPLIYAVNNGNIDIVNLLMLSGVDVNVIDSNGFSALSNSVARNHFEIFEILIKSSGIDLNICGGIAILYSCCNGSIGITKTLIEEGVNVNYISPQGYTPLHYACSYSRLEIVKFLMECGADENIKNDNGQTPIEITNNLDIVNFVKNYNLTQFVLK